jgi:hypothetical protein
MKILEYIGGALMVFSFLWIVGTAGALECDNITLLQCIIQGAIGFAIGWVGLKLVQFVEAVE